MLDLAVCVQQLSAFLEAPDVWDFDEGFELQFAQVGEKAERALAGIAKVKPGRGQPRVAPARAQAGDAESELLRLVRPAGCRTSSR